LQISGPRRIKEYEETQFADGYPVLMTSEESLNLLNQWIETDQKDEDPIPMDRFRPNVVISGAKTAFMEDVIFRAIIRGMVFRFVKACDRCVVPTTSQQTAKRGKEPTRTLRKHRLTGEDVLFGQNVVPETSPKNPFLIAINDQVFIDQIKPEFRLL
jgi:uncharacterized protein YcbX